MALLLKLQDFPGYKIAKAIYDKLPGQGIIKKIAVGALVVGTIIAGISLGCIGIAALFSFGAWVLTLPLLIQLGVIVSLTAVFTFVIMAIQRIWNFNWNISDKEIEKQIEESFNAFYGLIGTFAGKSIGYLVCGAIPGSLSFAFNRTLAAATMENLSKQAKDELLGQLSALAHTVFGTLINMLIMRGFKSARKWAKRPDSPFYQILKDAMGPEKFKKWGDDGQPQFTIGKYVDDQTETIKDPRLKNLTKQFLEGFSEGCIEAGYIVVSTIESHMAAQAMMNRRMGLNPDEEVVTVHIP
jgi:hypothetical protein